MNSLILPAVNTERCTGCGICAAACPEQVLEMVDAQPVFVHAQNCSYCAICEKSCPAGAIRCEFTVAWDETIFGGNQHE